MQTLLKKHGKFLAIAIGVFVVIGIISFLYIRYQNSQKLLQNPTLAAQMEAKDLVQKVGKLMDLPQGETPTIATVSDISKLQGQPFFAKAHNGDKVLIFATAREAILYSPATNKILQVAPVNMNAASGTPAPAQGAAVSPVQSQTYTMTPVPTKPATVSPVQSQTYTTTPTPTK